MPDANAPLQKPQEVSIPGVDTPYALDSRGEKPTTLIEIHLLQKALTPSIRSFTCVTGRPPVVVSGSKWLSYADQLDILQRESDEYWHVDGRTGPPPKLAQLGEWRGGIMRAGEARFCITEEMTEKFRQKKVIGNGHPDGSLGWHQDLFGGLAHYRAEGALSAADAKREGPKTQLVEREEDETLPEREIAKLDNIVDRDPERYLAWLSSMGYFYFRSSGYNHDDYGWEDWCKWQAPSTFENCCRQVPLLTRPTFGPGAIDRTKYGPVGDRPTITLDQAMKGNQGAIEFRKGNDGLEVCEEEKPAYHMNRGHAWSREGVAHSHGLQGDAARLAEHIKSTMEANDDPSR